MGGSGPGGPICQEKASIEEAVRSMAGSVLVNDWTLSSYLAWWPSKRANGSTVDDDAPAAAAGGHGRMPVSAPLLVSLLGPSTTAPASTGGAPSSEPTMLATWCWGQSGKVEPSPMMNDEPQGLAPSTLPSQRPANALYVSVAVR